jgi:molybdenum cofactor cytidylyltransferase
MPDSGSSLRGCDIGPVLDFGVVILGAGRSSRMGRSKLLLPWGRNTIVGHLIDQWRALHARQIAVVHAVADEALERELDNLEFPKRDRINNPEPERGMFSSIQCAAGWRGWHSGLSHWILTLGDQPQVRLETLRELLFYGKAHSGQICVPAFSNRGRHPVLLPKMQFEELAESKVSTLKDFLETREVCTKPIDDPGLEMDIDTPEAYQQALSYSFPGEK